MVQPWKKLNEEHYNAGFRKMIKKTFEMPDGKMVDFDINNGGLVVCVLALTSTNKVILAEQFRPGPEKILLEMPGGGVNNGEKPERAVERELLEETGYSGNIKLVGTCMDSAYTNIIRHVYVATDCKKIQEQNLDETEFAQVVELSLEDFRKHLRTGELTDVECGYLGLDFLGLL